MLLFNDYVIRDSKIIFHEKSGPRILEIDLAENSLNVLSIPEIKDDGTYRGCVRYGQRIFFIPMGSEHILEYNIGDRSYEVIEIPIGWTEEKEKFLSYTVLENRLYIFPWRFPAIVILNMDTKEVNTLTDWKEAYRAYQPNPDLTYFRKDVLVEKECAFSITWHSPVIFRFDLNTHKYNFIEPTGCEVGFGTICKTADSIILSDRNGELYVADVTFKEMRKIDPIGYKEKYRYFESFYLNNRVWFVGWGKVIVSLDCENMAVDYIEIESVKPSDKFTCVKPINEYEILIQTDSERMYLYNAVEQKLTPICISRFFDADDFYRIVCENVSEKIWKESWHSALGLEGYLSFLSNRFQDASDIYENKMIGEKILEYV